MRDVKTLSEQGLAMVNNWQAAQSTMAMYLNAHKQCHPAGAHFLSSWLHAASLMCMLSLLTACTCCFGGSLNFNGFVGDGSVEDTGRYYPRYRVSFPAISATADGTYRYQFRGMPSATFELFCDIADEAAYEAIKLSRTNLSVTLTDSTGAVLLEQSGRLEREKGDDRAWWLSRSSTLMEYYAESGNHVVCNPKQEYVLVLRVTASAAPRGGDAKLVPVLRGGGCKPLVQKL